LFDSVVLLVAVVLVLIYRCSLFRYVAFVYVHVVVLPGHSFCVYGWVVSLLLVPLLR